MRKVMWAIQLARGSLVHYEYSDYDFKTALFKTRARAQAWLDDNHFWKVRSAKVVKVTIRIDESF
jgi:hypothetical protein